MSFERFVALKKKIADLSYATAVLQWDKEVSMPKGGAAGRNQQVSTLSGVIHELSTSSEMGDLLSALSNEQSLDAKQERNIHLSKKDYDRNQKFSTDFVMKMTKTIGECYHKWLEAREANDFGIYRDKLKELVDLQRESAEIVGYQEHPYDALIDVYESGMTVAALEDLFNGLKADLVPFIQEIQSAEQVQDNFMYQHFDKQKQWDFGIDILKQMGYDMDRGRQDISEHPFTINFSSNDVRVTTRVNENNFNEMLWSCIHEGGHALYEQGLPAEDYGLETGGYLTLGIHESQSRLWENNVGRSLGFWKFNYPKLQSIFPEQLKNTSVEAFYKGMNKVQPSLIRVEADELTYHLHIIIRYEIERALIEGSLEVADVRDAWNDKYRSYLGVEVGNDKEGVLQDIHWSHGSFGYFPTYSIGSLYAAQFFQQAETDIPGLAAQIESGNLSDLLNWLRDKVHQHGSMYDANDLAQKICGEHLNHAQFMTYVRNKYGYIYNL